MIAKTVLLVDDEPMVRFGIRKFLERRGFGVTEAANCREARAHLGAPWPTAAVFDHRLPDGTALDLLDLLRDAAAPTQVIVLTGHATIDLAVEAMKRGAANFLAKPMELSRLAELLDAITASPTAGREPAADGWTLPDPFLGTSPAVRRLEQQARRVARAESPVLLLGETGSGKSLLARWIHHHSGRHSGPFVDLNCGGLNRDLLETELFGHKAGAFTGAHADKPGLLETANRGTVFLDEIGDADVRVQTKLLKVLEERRLRRLGEVTEREVDFRLITATHRDLSQRILGGQFREDLFYRISILPLVLSPLRERQDDVPVLAEAIFRELARTRRFELTPGAVERLQAHSWPGNLRELRNVLERAVLFADGDRIGADDIQLDPIDVPEPTAVQPAALPPGSGEDLTLEAWEIFHIQRVLREVGGNVSRAAEKLAVPRSSLYDKLKRYGLQPPSET